MVMICHCRQISDEGLKQAFESHRQATYGKPIEDISELEPLLGKAVCGGCSRIFERAATQFNETGEINIFRRSRKAASFDDGNNTESSGLCSFAQTQDYATGAQGDVPDLRRSPILGS
jgi:bacterioferritin-associated ferredoxin